MYISHRADILQKMKIKQATTMRVEISFYPDFSLSLNEIFIDLDNPEGASETDKADKLHDIVARGIQAVNDNYKIPPNTNLQKAANINMKALCDFIRKKPEVVFVEEKDFEIEPYSGVRNEVFALDFEVKMQ